jgi:hypothetical protein
VAWVREPTILTERPPLVGEVNDNFYGLKVPRGQRDGSFIDTTFNFHPFYLIVYSYCYTDWAFCRVQNKDS